MEPVQDAGNVRHARDPAPRNSRHIRASTRGMGACPPRIDQCVVCVFSFVRLCFRVEGMLAFAIALNRLVLTLSGGSPGSLHGKSPEEALGLGAG